MPSTSKKQHNFMEAVANNPKFAKKAGVPQSVGKEFAKADKGMKFRQGGVKRMAGGGKVKRYVEGGTLEMMTGEKQNGPEYSADDIKEGLKNLGRFFSFSRPESEPSAPIETRVGSPKTKANVLDENRELIADAQKRMSEAVLKPAMRVEPPMSLAERRADYEGGASPSSFVSKASKPIEAESAAPKMAAPAATRVAAPVARSVAPKVEAAPKSTTSTSGGQGRSASAYKDYDVAEARRSAERNQERERLKNYDYRKDAIQPDTTLEEAASYLLGGAGAVKGLLGLGKSTVGKLLGAGAKSDSLKSQAINEVNAARAAAGDARGPVSGAISPKGTGPSKEARRMMGEEIEPAAIKPTGQGPSQAAKDLMERSGTRQNKVAPEAESAADKARRLISERRAAEKEINDKKAQAEVDKQLEEARRKIQAKKKPDKRLELQGLRRSKNESLNAKPSGPESQFAKGGKIKAFAKGGFVKKSIDGCAQRGKTRGQIK